LALENNGPDAFSQYLQRVFSSSSLETPFTHFRRYVRGETRRRAVLLAPENKGPDAASILGIDRSTMYEKIKRYDIPR
jgi:transcriptional regulator of acetoin/glycerol metabolism